MQYCLEVIDPEEAKSSYSIFKDILSVVDEIESLPPRVSVNLDRLDSEGKYHHIDLSVLGV